MPNLTGAITTVEGAVATTIADDAITGGKLANDIAISTTGAITTTGINTSASLVLTPTATGSAPSASDGKLYFDSTKDALMVSDGSVWEIVNQKTQVSSAATVTTYSNYNVHSFLSGSTTFTVTGGSLICDILLVAGGGGTAGAEGYNGSCGGGGAGGLVEITGLTVEPGAYTIVVGIAGAGNNSTTAPGSNGGNSTGFGYTASGGGNGPDYAGDGGVGGSGGGGAESSRPGGAANQNTYSSDSYAVGYGNAGSAAGGYPSGNGGGGGGAGAAGSGVGNGSGGAGRANNWRTGSGVSYAAGGDGGQDDERGSAGAVNSGDGSDANSTASGDNSNGYAGGSGIVVIRYAI